MPKYAYRGNSRLIDAIGPRLEAAGFEREGEVELADFVVTFCTSMTELEDLYFEEDGLAQVMRPQSIAVDLSAATPNLAGEISGVCAVSDIRMVSAPMEVVDKVAADSFEKSNMACYAGGEGDAVDSAMELLDAIFGDVKVMPDAGTAQLAHAATTIREAAEMVSATEVLSLYRACMSSVSPLDLQGTEPEFATCGGSKTIEAVKAERFEGGYTVEMLLAELSAAMMTGDDYELIMPQTEAAFHLYELLAVIGGADMSPAALALVFEGEKEEAYAHGLDWHRAEHLYGEVHADEAVDAYEADELDFDDFDDDDEFGSGFGYSVN